MEPWPTWPAHLGSISSARQKEVFELTLEVVPVQLGRYMGVQEKINDDRQYYQMPPKMGRCVYIRLQGLLTGQCVCVRLQGMESFPGLAGHLIPQFVFGREFLRVVNFSGSSAPFGPSQQPYNIGIAVPIIRKP